LTNQVQPVFTLPNAQAITYGTDPVKISGQLAAGSQIPSGDVTVTLDGVAQEVRIRADGSFSTSFRFATPLGVADSPYTVSYVFQAEGFFLGAQGTSQLTVNPATLTVTATDESMTDGGPVPALTYTYTGLVDGDTTAAFAGLLATSATSASGVGRYAITQGTLVATGDYTIGTFDAGTLTVRQAPGNVAAAVASGSTGGSNGFVEGRSPFFRRRCPWIGRRAGQSLGPS
jgi:mucin-19